MFTAAALLATTTLAQVSAHMKEGVNITRWMCYQSDYTKQGCENYLSPQDFQTFRKLKIDYVRLCVSPEFIFNHGAPTSERVSWLDGAINKLVAAKLVVLLDLHDNGQLGIDKEGADNRPFVAFWVAMAKHYKAKHEGQVVFELVNEPVFENNESTWWDLQKATIAAVRKVDKSRVIVATGTGWGGIDGLVRHEPVAGANLIYSAHCYDPFQFTHQGATWAGEDPKHYKNFPFPSSPEAVAKMIDTIEDKYKDTAKWYGEQRFGQAYLQGRIDLVANWGRKHHVPVFMGEFGAYPIVSPPESRAAWFRMMRVAFKSAKLSPCLWGYDDGFGLGREVTAGNLSLDPVTIKNFYGSN